MPRLEIPNGCETLEIEAQEVGGKDCKGYCPFYVHVKCSNSCLDLSSSI
jgi:hypothetical protein